MPIIITMLAHAAAIFVALIGLMYGVRFLWFVFRPSSRMSWLAIFGYPALAAVATVVAIWLFSFTIPEVFA